MHIHRDTLFLIVLGTLAAQGCGASSSVDAPAAPKAAAEPSGAEKSPLAAASAASADSKVADSPSSAVPKAPAKLSAEQIAKWGIPEHEPLVLLACHDGFSDSAVLSLAVSPDGKQFALGGAKLTLWNMTGSEPAAELLANYKPDEVERPLRALAISADGKWLAAGDQKGKVFIWTLSEQREMVAIQAHDARVMAIAFSPDSRTLVTTSYSGDVVLWQLPDGKKLKSLKMGKHEITHLVFLSEILLASAGGEANIWNIENGAQANALTTKYVPSAALGLSRDRRFLAFNDPDGIVHLWDVAASKLTGVALRGAGAGLIDFSHDGKWIATYSGDSTVRIWDAATGSVVQVIDADGGTTSAVRWLPNANALLVASAHGRVRLWGTGSAAGTIGVQPIQLPDVATSGSAKKSLTPAQFQQVIDIRSFPRLPGAVPQWSEFGACAYTAPASQQEAELFYRYYLEKAGWVETARPATSQPGLTFRKADCELNVSFAKAADYGTGRPGDLRVSMDFAGNYDARWLPKFSGSDAKSSYESFSSVSYRTKAELTDVEVDLLKKFHDAGWTAYTRLGASRSEDPDSRTITMLQGASELTVSIGYPADSKEELYVQTGVNVSEKSLPIPPDAGWIEFDSSTDLQLVINTKMELRQTTEFYDTQMAAEGWLARKAGRQLKEDRGWLPYIRGQQDVTLGLVALPNGGTRIIAGDAARSSWQLQKPAAAGEKNDKTGIQAADFALPSGATAVKFDVDQKKIEFTVAGATPPKLGEQFVTQMESLKWKRESAQVLSDQYVLLTFSKEKSEIQFRGRADANQAIGMISGDGLLWDKPLPTAPVRISYGTWLVRGNKRASLDHLDEFAAEMRKIPAGGKK